MKQKKFNCRSCGRELTSDHVFKCRRCGHEWGSGIFSKDNPPKACAKCKTTFWNKESEIEKAMKLGIMIPGKRKAGKK